MTKLIDYKPLTHNPNKGTQRGTGILEQSVRELGAGRSILVDKNGVILAGNHAQEAFVNAGMNDVIEVETDGTKIVVVKRTDLDADSSAGKKMAIMDNRTSEQGLAWDAVVVEDLLNEIKNDEGELDAYLESLAKDTGAVIGDAPAEDQGAQIDKAEELRVKWGVELGQLWQLGEHRLICGDCTDKVVVDRVMGGEKADLELHDPPYNIGKDYQGENLDINEFQEFHASWLRRACEIAKSDTTPFYIFTGCKTLFDFADVIRKYLLKPRLLIWYRPDGHGAGGSDYFYNYDPVFYCSISGKIGMFEFSDFARDVWIANKAKPEEGGFEHSTVKSIEVIEQPIKSSSPKDGVVIDFFLGSGTTLIACERLNRKCRAVEISPAYCAVAIQRWVDMTGQEPVLLDK